MALMVTVQLQCDRCGKDIGDPSVGSQSVAAAEHDEPPLVSIEADQFGIQLRVLRDLCDQCRKELPSLLQQVVSAKPKSGKKKKDGGK